MNPGTRPARRIALWLAIGLAVPLSLVAVVVLALWPPEPLVAERRDLTLSGVTVVNPGAGRRQGQRISIREAGIESVMDDAGDAPADAHRFADAFVLPGLIDLHVHQPPAQAVADTHLFALLYLSHGVTSVRDAGNFDGSVLETREQIERGDFAGPRVYACGPIIDGDPPVWPGSVVARDAQEGERAVDEIAATGVHCIKSYQNLSARALAGVRSAATRHGLPLVGHVPSEVALERAQLDDIQHLTGIASRKRAPAQAGPAALIREILLGWAELDDATMDRAVRISVEQGLVHTPTIVVLDRLSRLDEYELLLEESDSRLVPRYYREAFWRPEGLDALQGRWPGGELVRGKVRALVRRLHDAGVVLHVGTDVLNPFVIPGAAMHRELENLTESGFTIEEAWAAATRGNGAALPLAGLGVIEAGAPADLLVFRADPTRDLAALSTLEAVVAGGRFYSKQTLDDAVARQRRKFEGWLYDRLSMLVFRALSRAMLDPRPAPADDASPD